MTPFLKFGICFSLLSIALNSEAICVDSIPASTPTSRFIDNTDGTVTDTRTGLMWMRCSLGQAWSGSTCTGTAAQYVWVDALTQAQASTFATYSDWRVPNVKELTSIVERQCHSPSINSEIFPSAIGSLHWTSSPSVSGNGNYAIAVSFSLGGGSADNKAHVDPMFHYNVRLVRTVR